MGGSSVRPSSRAASGTNTSGANGPPSTDDSSTSGSTTSGVQVPEPSMVLLFGAGAAAVFGRRRRKRVAQVA